LLRTTKLIQIAIYVYGWSNLVLSTVVLTLSDPALVTRGGGFRRDGGLEVIPGSK